MRSEVYAKLTISGVELDPDAVTASVGIEPSETWRIGDNMARREGSRRYKNNGWRLKSGIHSSGDLAAHIDNIFDALRTSWSTFKELSDRYEVQVTGVIRSYGGDRPEIFLSPRLVRQIAELNAIFDIDLYIFDEDDGE